jgi:N-acetyltransferase 10
LLARTVETVEGGGIVIMLLSNLRSLTQLYTLTMDVHARLRTDAHQTVTGRQQQQHAVQQPSIAEFRSNSLLLQVPTTTNQKLSIGMTHVRNAPCRSLNQRLVLSLASNRHCLIMDDELNVLPTSSSMLCNKHHSNSLFTPSSQHEPVFTTI